LFAEQKAQMTGYPPSAFTLALVACATISLTACGPGDAPSANDTQGAAAQNTTTPASPDTALQAARADASAPLASRPDAASTSAVTSVQASLAADSQQVAPVLRYAPGDGSSH
jgi:hypothetical protein